MRQNEEEQVEYIDPVDAEVARAKIKLQQIQDRRAAQALGRSTSEGGVLGMQIADWLTGASEDKERQELDDRITLRHLEATQDPNWIRNRKLHQAAIDRKNKEISLYGSELPPVRAEIPLKEEKKMKNPCWKGYEAYGMKKKNGKEVPNCVPIKEEIQEATKQSIISKLIGTTVSPKQTKQIDEMFMLPLVARNIANSPEGRRHISNTPGEYPLVSSDFKNHMMEIWAAGSQPSESGAQMQPHEIETMMHNALLGHIHAIASGHGKAFEGRESRTSGDERANFHKQGLDTILQMQRFVNDFLALQGSRLRGNNRAGTVPSQSQIVPSDM